MLEEYPDVLNTNEVMEILDITKNLMYELIHSAIKIGKKQWRITKDDLITYLKTN